MTTPDLKALSEAATQGQWSSLREFHFNSDKRYAVALVNLHRAGQLYTAADVAEAVRKENEACAEIADNKALYAKRAHDMALEGNEGHSILTGTASYQQCAVRTAAAIRARTTQGSET